MVSIMRIMILWWCGMGRCFVSSCQVRINDHMMMMDIVKRYREERDDVRIISERSTIVRIVPIISGMKNMP